MNSKVKKSFFMFFVAVAVSTSFSFCMDEREEYERDEIEENGFNFGGIKTKDIKESVKDLKEMLTDLIEQRNFIGECVEKFVIVSENLERLSKNLKDSNEEIVREAKKSVDDVVKAVRDATRTFEGFREDGVSVNVGCSFGKNFLKFCKKLFRGFCAGGCRDEIMMDDDEEYSDEDSSSSEEETGENTFFPQEAGVVELLGA